MKKLISYVLTVFIVLNSSLFVNAATKTSTKTTSKTVVRTLKTADKVVEMVNKSVVAIIGRNEKYKPSEEYYSKLPQNLQHGSGVVIDKDGKILTNNHVIDGLNEIYVVTYDGKAYRAKLLYSDKDIDLALIQIDRKDLPPIKLANEKDIKVGIDVLAIGTPLFFGYRNTATKGIVSGLNRPVDGVYTYLQTDAAINPGNSGGPLVNLYGELVGINTYGYLFFQGMSFSIPVGNINYFLNHYNKYGRIRRCYTGIEFEENWAAILGIPTEEGLKVVALQSDAVVTEKQVKEGDILVSINGKKITSIAEYNEILKSYLPGDKVKLTFDRNGKKFTLSVVLKEKKGEN